MSIFWIIYIAFAIIWLAIMLFATKKFSDTRKIKPASAVLCVFVALFSWIGFIAILIYVSIINYKHRIL